MIDPGWLVNEFAFTRWADEQQMAAAEQLTAEAFARPQDISAGSVHKMLLHMLGAQRAWRARFEGHIETPFPQPVDLPTMAEVRREWARVHGSIDAFLTQQTAETLAREVRFRRGSDPREWRGPLVHLVQHMLGHAIYHRGQLNTMLRHAGGTPTEPYHIRWFLETARLAVEG